MNVSDSEIKQILSQYKKISVVGLSHDSTKPGQRVALYMRSKGYDLVGIRPGDQEVAGFKCYSDLQQVPAEYRQFVDVFRRPEHIPEVVDEVLRVGGVKVLWLQQGIMHPVAEKKAEDAGLKVISNRCLHLEYERCFGAGN